MHFIVMGCGRVGSQLAMDLQNMGHTVAVIDANPETFHNLPPEFTGEKIQGFGFDIDTLRRAGAQNAFSFAAVTAKDNTNAIAARVAREEFGIEKVVARVYNTSRAEIFEKIGIPTVATLKWTRDQILRKMIPLGSSNVFEDANGKVSISEVDFDDSWITHTVAEIEQATSARVAYISRMGDSFIPTPSDRLQVNDTLFMLSQISENDKVSHTLGRRFDLAELPSNKPTVKKVTDKRGAKK